MSHAKCVAPLMPKLYTATVIHIALVAKALNQATMTTYSQASMCPNSKGQPKDLKNEESQKQPANTTKYIETENFSASLISAAIKVFDDSKQKAS